MSGFNIIQASLIGNLPTIQLSLGQFKRYYPGTSVSVVCPDKDCGEFRRKIADTAISFIPESSILSFEDFRKIAIKELSASTYETEITPRLGWYYQQVLKIALLIDTIERTNQPVLLWDADTVPLRKMKFFEGGHSIKYGSTVEFHVPYFKTAKEIFGELPPRFLSSTVQFVGATVLEKGHLIKRLSSYLPKPSDATLGQWIGQIVMKAVVGAHREYSPSMISEQDVLGISNLLLAPAVQTPVVQLRWGVEGRLTGLQSMAAKCLGFDHVTYENPASQHQATQPWRSFWNLCRDAIQRRREFDEKGMGGEFFSG
ncbi:MAG: DUF6492 family protein [Bdellovibrionia bacterium]